MIDPVHEVLAALTVPGGGDARAWAIDPLREHGRVVTLRPRSDTVDVLVRDIAGTVRATPAALPFADDALDGVALVLGLHVVTELDALFAELRRVLRPAGTLVVVTPSVSVRSVAEARWLSALRPVRRGPWGHRSALDGVGWLLAAADFAVLGDDRVPFVLPLPDAAAAARAVATLPGAGLWPAGLSAEVRAGLAVELSRRAGPGGALPVPLRRLVARR